jgi:hypothetical protein
MGKPKNSKSNAAATTVNKNADPRDAYLSTKSAMVVAESDIPLTNIYSNAIGGIAVIAEDAKGFYVTGKNYVDSPMMDPFRQYHRNMVTVEKSETSYDIITKDGNMYSVAIA